MFEIYKNIINKLEISSVLSLSTVLLAGLIDGINPCALSMLLFFIMYLTINLNKKVNIFFIGIMFATGTFIAYFLSGIGIIKIINLVSIIKSIKITIYLLLTIFSFVLAYLNFLDFLEAKKYNISKIRLQLSDKNKEFIMNLIKKITTYKSQYIISLILGFVLTLSELLCTGQIYLYFLISISNFDYLNKVFYLFVFNIGFVTPILLITFILQKGKEVMELSNVLFEKLWVIKIITSILMLFIGFYAVYNFIKIF